VFEIGPLIDSYDSILSNRIDVDAHAVENTCWKPSVVVLDFVQVFNRESSED
jgi:hypothetical protein